MKRFAGCALLLCVIVMWGCGTKSNTGGNNGPSSETAWVLNEENTTVQFTGTKPKPPGYKHDGKFQKVSGEIDWPEDVDNAEINLVIDMTSLWTDDDKNEGMKLNKHLQSGDFFYTKKYPKARFVSMEIEKDGANYKITGNLTLHGKTESITIPAEITATEKNLKLKSAFSIDRSIWDVGMKNPQWAPPNIDKDVQLKITIDATK